MSHVEEFFRSIDKSQPMTPQQVREFERAHWLDKQEQHGASDRRLLAKLLAGQTPA